MKKTAVKKSLTLFSSDEDPVATPAVKKRATKKKAVTVTTPTAPAPAKKKATPPPSSVAPTTTPKSPRNNTKRDAVLTALKALGATQSGQAITAQNVSDNSGGVLSLTDAKHYLYKDEILVSSGQVAIVKLEGSRVMQYHVT